MVGIEAFPLLFVVVHDTLQSDSHLPRVASIACVSFVLVLKVPNYEVCSGAPALLLW